MPLDILNVVQLRGKWVIDVNGDEFPICLTFIKEGHCAKDFHLFDLAWVANFFTNFTDVEGVIVTFCFGFWVHHCWIFPCLKNRDQHNSMQIQHTEGVVVGTIYRDNLW